jgi:hypothetical protein
MVNEYLQTSHRHLRGRDNAYFHYVAIEQRTRVEHWDNATQPGASMRAEHGWRPRAPYSYLPFFFSDLFEFGYEAVGEIDARLPTIADWQQENHTGVVYYLRDGRVTGVMLCNVWEKVERARELIRGREAWTRDTLRGAIR